MKGNTKSRTITENLVKKNTNTDTDIKRVRSRSESYSKKKKEAIMSVK